MPSWVFQRRPRTERQQWVDLAVNAQENELRQEELKAMAQTLGKTMIEEAHEDQARHTLLLQGRERFGEPPPEILLTLQKSDDLDRLDRLALRLLRVSSWTELLETP